MLPVTRAYSGLLDCVQLERLELLWTNLHDMGISREEDDEDSSDLPPPFPYSGALSASKPTNSYADTPTKSSRHATWSSSCLTIQRSVQDFTVRGCELEAEWRAALLALTNIFGNHVRSGKNGSSCARVHWAGQSHTGQWLSHPSSVA